MLAFALRTPKITIPLQAMLLPSGGQAESEGICGEVWRIGYNLGS